MYITVQRRLGHTKVFFRAGALAKLEEIRDDIVTGLLRKLQVILASDWSMLSILSSHWSILSMLSSHWSILSMLSS